MMRYFLRRSILLVIPLLLINGCISPKKYADLIDKVEAQESLLLDDDGDGVINGIDLEPDTPQDAMVDTRGITLDSDGDGIPDYKDFEPYSPVGYGTDNRGVAQLPQQNSLSEEEVNGIINARMSELKALSGTNDKPSDLNALNFPILNIPPPPTRKMKQFPVSLVFPNTYTYGDVNTALTKILQDAGFKLPGEDQPRYSYFQIKDVGAFGGFALVTDFEQTSAVGKPFQKRFDLAVNRAEYTSIWDRLFLAPLGKGYFRLFAFLVADEYYGQPGEALTRSGMQERLTDGARVLHPDIVSARISPNARLHVLVYEFEQLETDQDGRPTELPGMNVEKHLRAAGLNALIK